MAVCDIPGKGRVQLDMPCDVDGSLHVSVVIPVADISLEEPFSHGRLQVVREEKKQEIEKTVVLVCVRFQIHDVGKVQHALEEVFEKRRQIGRASCRERV